MYSRPLFLFIIISIVFSYSSNNYTKFNSFNDLIIEFPEFLKSNYFEKGNYYYCISNTSNTKQYDRTIDNKTRLKTLSYLNESVCCGEDIMNKKNNFNPSASKSSIDMSYESSSMINNVEILLDYNMGTSYIYAIRVNKQNFKTHNCECNYTHN